MDALFRIGLAAALIFTAFALGMLVLTSQALPQEVNRVGKTDIMGHIQPPRCSPRERAIGRLETNFNEELRGLGFVSETQVLELHIADTGSWTVIVTNPLGMSCVVTSGTSWTAVAPKPSGKGS